MDDILERFSSHIKTINGVYAPINDNMTYRINTLKNKLQIFFVETKNSNISSATMYVDVGNIDNPRDIDGMAHYLEHMLFMGSDQYPGGSYFQNQVSSKGGFTNAYTTDSHTQYYFSTSEGFLDLLKIFSRFFVKPLFDVKYVEKEVSAVDSEHKKNISSDGWRTMNLSSEFFTDGINDRFSTGTRESLLGDSVNKDPIVLRERLVNFYETLYSADRMILFISNKVLSERFIDDICNMFVDVPLRDTQRTDDTARVRITDNEYEMIKIKTVNESNYLTVKWLINGSELYENNLCVTGYDVLSHILSHCGPGSLYEILVKLGLIVGMWSGVESSFKNNCMYNLQLKLTVKGYENMEDILYIIDAYIKKLIKLDNKSSKMFESFFKEVNDLTLLHMTTINNIDGLSLCQHYSDLYNRTKVDLHLLPIAELLIKSAEQTRKHFKSALKSMNIEMDKVIITSPFFDESELTKIDKYYGTRYNHNMVPIDQSYQDKLSEFQFTVPELNTYVSRATNMCIIDTIEKDSETYCSIKSDVDNVYYVKRGNTYHTYNVAGYISINLKALQSADPENYVALLIHCMYVNKLCQSELYMMMSAKIVVSVVPEKNRLFISIEGYNSDLGIDLIFKRIMNWYGIFTDMSDASYESYESDSQIQTDLYELVYNNIKTECQNYQYADSYTLISPEFKNMINKEHNISNDQMLIALETFSPDIMKNCKNKINYKNFRTYCTKMIKIGDITGVFGGSINMQRVRKIINLLDTSIIKPSESARVFYSIPKSMLSVKLVKQNRNPNNNETAIGYGLYVGNIPEIEDSLHEESWTIKKPMCMMLEGYISEKFSASVRTEKEVGYVAISNMLNINESNNVDLFLVFVVQSTRDDLEDIVKEYVDNHLISDVESMSDDEFDSLSQSIIISLSEKPQNIYADCNEKLTALLNTYEPLLDVQNMEHRFARKQLMVNAAKSINKDMFVKFTKQIVMNNIRSVLLIIPHAKCSP